MHQQCHYRVLWLHFSLHQKSVSLGISGRPGGNAGRDPLSFISQLGVIRSVDRHKIPAAASRFS